MEIRKIPDLSGITGILECTDRIFPVESEIESMLNGKEDVDTAVQKMSDSINKAITDYNTVNN